MIELEKTLEKKLRELRVKVETPDGDTVLMRDVPVSEAFFNKPRTNLLIKRPREGMPYVVCVDEDLRYTGSDPSLARAFAGASAEQGWRALYVRADLHDYRRAIAEALVALGFDGRAPCLLTPQATKEETKESLLAIFGNDLSRETGEPTVGREEQAEFAVSCVIAWQRRLALIVGESGVGKTNLLYEVARRLRASRNRFRVISVDMGIMFAGTLFDSERENLLSKLLDEATEDSRTVVALEHIDLAVSIAPQGAMLLARAIDRGARLIGTALPALASRLETATLARRLQVIELGELSLSESEKVIMSVKDSIALHHGVETEDDVAREAVDFSLGLAGRLPAKAIALLDAAAGMASIAGERELSSHYLRDAAFSFHQSET
ncbi:MAG TPA: AAA family ATPase [Blastocatellia bacterium]